MIVPMKKIILFCLERDQEAMLHELQDMSVLHVTHMNPPESGELEQIKEYYHKLCNAYDAISPYSHPEMTNEKIDFLIDEIEGLIKRKKEVEESLKKLNREKQRLQPYGNFNKNSLEVFREKGIWVRLYRSSVKNPPVAPENTSLHILNKDKHCIYFAIIGTHDFQCNYREFQIPDLSLSEIEEKISSAEEQQKSLYDALIKLSGNKNVLAERIQEIKDRIVFLEVKEAMGTAEGVVYIQGFCPFDTIEKVKQKANEKSWGIIINDPAPDDNVPTLVKNPAWVKPIKTVFHMINIVPGYREIDISSAFLIFFSIFSAVLIGDAGYGAFFLVLTLITRVVFPKAPAEPFFLLGILSVCTMLWGILTGNYFGITHIPGMFQWLRIEWLSDERHVIHLCFFIGATHLTVAHAWNSIKIINSTRAIAQVGWIGMTWIMYFAAKAMILDETFPSWGMYLVIFSLVSIVLFQVPPKKLKQDWPVIMMFPLHVIGNFVDIVSYIRLFAVSSASLAVATSFNEMATGKGVSDVFAGLMAATILFMGHGLNIALIALGILVHGVRLNTLEFSGHIGVQWKGFPYNPFTRITRP
ncbi:MAG: hypothetical protein MRJ65_01455 [Candidatus Brocadiaceae bacterium]|nr:hypothetical protein [Candidatus Brocadiaceae bacterium]